MKYLAYRCQHFLHLFEMKTLSTILTEDDKSLDVCSCCRDCDLLVLNAGLGDKLIVSNTDNILSSHTPTEENSDAGLHTCFTIFQGKLKNLG